jgi:hypothetical protein
MWWHVKQNSAGYFRIEVWRLRSWCERPSVLLQAPTALNDRQDATQLCRESAFGDLYPITCRLRDEVNNTAIPPPRDPRGGDFLYCTLLRPGQMELAQANGEQMCSDKRVLLTVVNPTEPTTFVQRNIQACSCNHCQMRRVMGITYSECVSAALSTQREIRMRHMVMCCLPRSATFLRIIS